MIALSHKSKQYGLIALKVLILSVTFGYLYLKIRGNDSLHFGEFIDAIRRTDGDRWIYLFIFLAFATINWFFEILKWKTVLSNLEKISFSEAAKQSLTALTVSLATPNRIGDYGAKAYFFPKNKRKQVLLLNFFSNGVQMATTIVFGSFGLILIAGTLESPFSGTKIIGMSIVVLVLLALGYFFKEKQLLIKGLSLSKVMDYIRRLPGVIKLKTLLYSVVRYLVFSMMFSMLLNYFGAGLTPVEALPTIFAMYFLVSVIPTFFIMDVVVRGGVAIWLFSMSGTSELTVLCTVLAMWLLNFVIPAIWGSFYVVTYRRS